MLNFWGVTQLHHVKPLDTWKTKTYLFFGRPQWLNSLNWGFSKVIPGRSSRPLYLQKMDNFVSPRVLLFVPPCRVKLIYKWLEGGLLGGCLFGLVCLAWFGSVRFGLVRFGSVWLVVLFCFVLFGFVWFCLVVCWLVCWFVGLVWFGSVCFALFVCLFVCLFFFFYVVKNPQNP